MASPSKPLLIRRASSFHHEQASLPFRRSLSTSRETAEEDDDGALPGIFGINTHLDIAHVDWPDGCAYTGEIDNSVAHGVGVKRSPEGWLYCGQWSHGKENGLGVYLWSDGSWYAGEWTQGQSDGLGVWCSCRRNVYAGDWTQGQKDKLGKQTWGDGGRMVEYIGMWRLGKRAGLGVEDTMHAARVSGQPSFMSDMSLSDLQLDAVQLGRLSPVALHASAISLARSCSTLNVDALGSSATHTNDATNYEHNNTNSNSITNSTGPPQLLSTTPWAVEAQQQHRLHSQSVTNLSEGTATTKKLSPTSSTASSSSSSSAAAAQRQRALWNAGLPPPTASLPSVAASAPPLRQRGRVVSNASTRTYKSNTSDTSTASHFSAQSYQPFRQQQQQQRRRQQQRHRRSSQFKSSRLLSAGQLAVLHAAPNARHQSKSKPASSSSAPTSTSSPPSSSTGIAWKRRRRGQSATAPPLPTIPSSSTSSSPQPSVVGSASPARTSQPRQRSSRTRHALSSASSSSLASQSRVLRRLLILAVAFGAFAIVIAIFAALAS
ncbi:hypothetical protein PTSG_09072 [Salpingoeca rosetta]|uniref:Uncharacterized protein n=1 Tax=Salpingoeca rosetta (strain ATCC 50818 / BSB-021) TaxID=946362 RepID=F2UM46_SALR5|nr:uncharacterized protein PTSG_09072 [Salpingoeca rosetta]EGD78195.1 hypothetical protein PTSG_09072 [Salpingoeca rosetta]|eukprot:XP_004989871.1 hypothetical protein PTSG_09072 [Salpingoeca rosetta]